MNILTLGQQLFALVKTTDTPIEELYESFPDLSHEEVNEGLKLLTGSVVEVRTGVYQRWHGIQAQELIKAKGKGT